MSLQVNIAHNRTTTVHTTVFVVVTDREESSSCSCFGVLWCAALPVAENIGTNCETTIGKQGNKILFLLISKQSSPIKSQIIIFQYLFFIFPALSNITLILSVIFYNYLSPEDTTLTNI